MKADTHLSDTPVMQTGMGKLSLNARAAGASRSKRSWIGRLFDWASSSRSHRVICLLVGVWLVSAFDLLLTVTAHEQGLLHESNPIAARILPHGAAAIAAYKLVLLTLPSIVLLTHRNQVLTEIAAAGVLVIYVIVAVQWRLCYELYTVTSAGHLSRTDSQAVYDIISSSPFL